MTRSAFGSIQRLDENRYRILWTDNGKRRSKRIRGSYEDAKRELALAYIQVGNISRSITWGEYWKNAVVPTFNGLSEHTVYEYTHYWDKYLENTIGKRKVTDFTWRIAQRVLDGIESPTAQRHVYRLLKKICNMAIRDQLLLTNPITRNLTLREHRKKKKEIYQLNDVKKLLKDIKDYPYNYIVAMELGGGLRHEEACAITCNDVAQHKEGKRAYAILSVCKAYTLVAGKKVLKTTKNSFSEREVVLGEPFASVVLDAQLPSLNYLPSPEVVTRSWKKYCEEHGLLHVPFGNLRTAYSMLHAEAKTPDMLVSLSMGHADGTTRGANYTQSSRKAMILVADSLTDALKNTR